MRSFFVDQTNVQKSTTNILGGDLHKLSGKSQIKTDRNTVGAETIANRT